MRGDMKKIITPSIDSLQKQLSLEWQDHIQTRKQTWKAIEITTLLAVALVGIDWKLENKFITVISSILLLIAAQFALTIIIHHRNDVECVKFTNIIKIEKQLGIYNPDYKKPNPVKIMDIFNFRRSNTSLFMMRIIFIIQIFALIYCIYRLFY
jgi:hypothetical protein